MVNILHVMALGNMSSFATQTKVVVDGSTIMWRMIVSHATPAELGLAFIPILVGPTVLVLGSVLRVVGRLRGLLFLSETTTATTFTRRHPLFL